jgi:hypothetical protein
MEFVNVSHPKELNHAANITTIRRTAMLAVHQDERRNRAKRILPSTKVAVGACFDPKTEDEQLEHHTTSTS